MASLSLKCVRIDTWIWRQRLSGSDDFVYLVPAPNTINSIAIPGHCCTWLRLCLFVLARRTVDIAIHTLEL